MASPSQAETLPVDELFANLDFQVAFGNWQHSRIGKDRSKSLLYGHFRDQYDDGERSEYEVSMSVDMALEASPDDRYMDDDRATELRTLHQTREAAEVREKVALLEAAKTLGISAFALYGLDVHLNSEDNLLRNIWEKTRKAEQDFSTLDTAVRRNTGAVVTASQSFGFQAGRIGEGGIAIVNGPVNNNVVLPILPNTNVYTMSRSEQYPELYIEQIYALQAHDVHSIFGSRELQIWTDWDLILDQCVEGSARKWIVFGEPTSYMPSVENSDSREYFETILKRINLVATAAMRGSADGLDVEVYSSDSSTIS